jgi:chemosensory pili system protein ChpA (sensor histidine kinase/response regulator)
MDNDNELIQIFVEEAHDILDAINRSFNDWLSNPSQKELLNSILRELHTFKGSSRMVGLKGISEYTHTLEQLIQKIHQGETKPDDSLLKELRRSFDYLHLYIDNYAHHTLFPDGDVPIGSIKRLLNEELSGKIDPEELGDISEEVEGAPQKKIKKSEGPTETVRIRADLLEKFSNLAGRINVSRSHLEQQVKGANEYLIEISKEIKLVQESMKNIEVKADANLRLYQESIGARNYDEFDILEMDRYSSLQQSIRVLEEKLTQLEDLSEMVIHVLRNAEGLLVEQKRAAKTLEEGIIHTRLISIDYLVPRLERIVRQVSEELGKEVHLKFARLEGEIDRRILERLISSLEHMVRNAIDHGIESPSVRLNMGKPELGVITLSLFRQGNQFIIQLVDDGQGIDIEKVRKKAIEKYFWPAKVPMTKDDAIKMIFLSGFSTKDEVSQISGHGVGMDVVNTEINKLGGTLWIDTEPNQGARFTIRLPFTISLNQALVFKSHSQFYALQLSQLAGVARMSCAEAKNRVLTKQRDIKYADKTYQLYFLSELLGDNVNEEFRNNIYSLSIIFLQSEDSSIAVIVDKMVGSNEIVIKPAGSQLQFVREISGVSLLGDGQIVLVLDPQYLMQRALQVQQGAGTLEQITTEPSVKINYEKTQVLVVDDSYTVRQVTSRLLKRHQFEVFQAKDGVDAMLVMEEDLPDIVLLDIEMPKMDGFEVLEKMRASERLKNIPVIMITSRSGEKHRLRAVQAGANAYLTKPYLEEDLLMLLKRFAHGVMHD